MLSVARTHPESNRLNLTVKILEPSETPRWDAFVESCPQGTFFHLSGWKQVIEKALGHPTHYLYVDSEDGIQGVLPLGHVKSWLFGNALISTPFCVYGGIAAATVEAEQALRTEAEHLAQRLGVDYLELRHRDSTTSTPPAKDLYVTFRKTIASDAEENFKSIPRKQRAMVRKGIQAGLTSVIEEPVDRFYAMYSTSVRNLGTPVLPRKWFEALKDQFRRKCEILTVTLDGRPLSSVMSFYFRDEVLPYYGGGTAQGRTVKANDFMYWEVMRRAAEKGAHTFDYGRSKRGTGSFSFKKNWGFTPEPLYYEYHLVRAEAVPDINPLNPKYRLFINLWKKTPLPVSRMLGPMLSRYLA